MFSFFVHLIVFFAHLVVFFAHLIVFCTSHCLLHILLFFAHLIVLHFFISLHILFLFLLFLPYVCPCYVTYIICILIVLHCHWADLIRLHFTSSYALYNYYVTNKETLNPWTLRQIVEQISYFFVFFTHKKYSCSFVKLRLNHWCHMDYFNDVLATFQSLDRVRILAVDGRVRELSEFIKNILIFFVPNMNEGLTGLERHEGK